MKPTSHNPMPGGAGDGGKDSDKCAKQATAACSAHRAEAVQATLTQAAFGWQVDLKPMRAFDALRIWSKLAIAPDAVSLLFDVTVVPKQASPPVQRTVSDVAGCDRFSLGALAERLSIQPVDRLGEDDLVMDSLPLRELVGTIEQAHMRCVLVEGPIESRDARDMRRAIAAGLSPLQVELRASASLEVSGDQAACFHSRQKKHALRMVAESFRLYLAAMRKRPIDEIAPPETWQVERLLSVTGTISFRPLETDMFSTFLDVGISTAEEPFTRPADRSLIYDIPSNTWHDEH